uniref:Uncharacterized protein n=1 Tax=viral metagenome TaxID=1070528 RepID=A0A6C0BND8_9ZZZZ
MIFNLWRANLPSSQLDANLVYRSDTLNTPNDTYIILRMSMRQSVDYSVTL